MADTSHLRVPPHNIDAEQSVLGSLMLDKDAIIKVADTLRTGDFYKPDHNDIYDAILSLYEKREPIDALSLSNILEERGKLDRIGGSAYITSLVNSVPTASNVSH
ncbi:MAG: DnaB-like helicase N-terminal domain-containing protein, partial [Candidatus Moraniibacteriota bacterium]